MRSHLPSMVFHLQNMGLTSSWCKLKTLNVMLRVFVSQAVKSCPTSGVSVCITITHPAISASCAVILASRHLQHELARLLCWRHRRCRSFVDARILYDRFYTTIGFGQSNVYMHVAYISNAPCTKNIPCLKVAGKSTDPVVHNLYKKTLPQ